MKFLTVAVIALAASYAAAECNNMCSGHGTCGANDACTCYRNWRGNDCSERTCQFGVAFVDTAQGDLDHDGLIDLKAVEVVTQWAPSGTFEEYPNFASAEEAHAYMECSNKGLCDRSSGECVCFPGYEGSACQRTVCPNACSGNGVCRNINDMSQALSATAATPYLLWDGLKNQACVCDPGYSGVDCAERLCPKGADPLIDEESDGTAVVNEEQTIDISDGGGLTAGDTFSISYTDVFGETWKTSEIPILATDTTTAVKDALMAIPNSVIEGVTVTAAASGTGDDGSLYTILFTHNAGDLNEVTVAMATGNGGSSYVTTIATTQPGTTVATECSGRGLCDYETGLCKCFRGYRLDDCSSQHALAFGTGATAGL